MRVLLDESLRSDIAAQLPGHDVQTVSGHGWSGLLNGELLRRAQGEFDVFVTMDQNLPHQQNLQAIGIPVKRPAPLVIAALVACCNSPTALDLSALDLSGRWTLLDSATAVQVDTDRVYATVVARGTVVLATLGTHAYTVTESFPLHFTLIDSTARLTMYESNSAGLVQDSVVARGDSLFGLTPDPIVAPPATISATKISLQESRVDAATTDANAMGCGRAVSLFTRLGSAPHPSSCTETLLLVKQ